MACLNLHISTAVMLCKRALPAVPH